MAEMERTLVIIKPDGVQRGLIGPIISRLEQRGLKFAALKLMQIDRPLAERHYGVHKERPFFAGLVNYITSAPVLVAVVEGRKAISIVRTTVGATNAAEAAPGTIRGDFAVEIGRNLIHASDSPESATHEISLFFQQNELVTYARSNDQWIFE